MDQLATIRRFNRTYTPKIGALDDSFLGSGLSLAAARLLYEVGPNGAAVRDLRVRLGLDSGYLSRLLRSLEQHGLVSVLDDPADRRRRVCRLTPTGRRRWSRLDARSDEVAAQLLEPLTAGQRSRLADALEIAELLIRTSTVAIELVDPTGDDATTALSAYFDELDARFPDGFDRRDALGVGASTMSAPGGALLVAVADDRTVVGCGGIQPHDDDTAEVKRMWIHPDWRGAGLGRRLLVELEQRCVALGYTTVVLDTNATLTEAIAMYEAAGYRPTEQYNDNPYAQHWFTKPLSGATSSSGATPSSGATSSSGAT
jgi:DNA-binding MarR family transcriptional regulator/GNAT superfamily N-acetyltransferase